MNIKMQCCGLMIMFVLIVFYRSRKKVRLNTEKIFWAEMLIVVACLIMDIVSVFAIVYRDSLPAVLVDAICKTYVVLLVWVSFGALVYVGSDIYEKKRTINKMTTSVGAVIIAVSILIYIVPIEIYHEGNVLYTYGPSTTITYLIGVIMIFIMLAEALRHWKQMNPERRSAVIIWTGIWVFGAAVQFFFPEILIVSFMATIGMLILYIKLENPERNVERQTGLFNQRAFVDYIKQAYVENRRFAVLSVSYEDRLPDIGKVGSVQMNWEAIEYLYAMKKAYVFHKSDDEIVIVFEEIDEAKERSELLMERFAEKRKSSLGQYKVSWVLIPDSAMIPTAEDMLLFIKYVHTAKSRGAEDRLLELDESVLEEMYQERDAERLLEEALKHDRVEVFYQPIFAMKDKAFITAEALVRIRDEEGNLIPPGRFIPVAEKNGKIIELGKMVFEQVCLFIKNHSMEQLGLKYIEVNLSVVQCADEKLADTYIAIMEKYNIPPQYIILEITESASLENQKVLLANMRKLIDYGVKFTLDDFGTGQSNLNYIVDMPVDIVKFDRGMMLSYFGGGKAKYVMDAAIHMIHGMSLEIVAEGIETQEQIDNIEDLGIGYVQGYYFSKPLPQTDFKRFLQENRA